MSAVLSRHYNHWSPVEDAVLRQHWPEGGMAAVAGRLPGRTVTAIATRARTLRLSVDPRKVIRKQRCPTGYEDSPIELAYWFAEALLSPRPRVPAVHQIKARWGVTTSTAYRWRRWALDKLDQIQAREGEAHADR